MATQPGFGSVQAKYTKLSRELLGMDELIKDSIEDGIRRYSNVIIRTHFNSRQGAVISQFGWDRTLNPQYARRKRLRYGNRPLLVASGTMRNEIARNKHRIRVNDRFRARLTFNLNVSSVRATAHDTGRGTVPRRRWSQPTTKDMEKIESWIDKKLQKRIDASERRQSR